VPIVNIDGVAAGQLRLTSDVIADIYMGKITKWDHPSITAINPGLKLPNANISVVHRSDGSGTTFIWTNWLSKTNPEWADKVKDGTAVKWPVGVGGKGNEGVSAVVQQLKNSIGYVEYAYAKRNKIPHAQVKNRDGNFVQPSDDTFKAAAANADWNSAPGMYLLLTDQKGKDAWPITGASFILMHKQQADALTGRAVLKFFDWSYKNGAKMSEDLEYVHLPQSVIKLVQDNWKRDLKGPDNNPIWK
jgi:phosphate transport system substrate-binding protein